MNAVKTNLKRLRTARKMTQDELAEKLHVVRQTVSSWETGKTTPDVETLTAIAEALEVDITELIYGAKPVDTESLLKTKRIKQAVTLISMTIVLSVLHIFWLDFLSLFKIDYRVFIDFKFHLPGMVLSLFSGYILPTMVYLSAGVTVIAVIRSWRELSIQSAPMRLGILIIGTVPLAIYLIAVLLMSADTIFFILTNHPLFDFNLESQLLWIMRRQYFFLLNGIFIALGLSHK